MQPGRTSTPEQCRARGTSARRILLGLFLVCSISLAGCESGPGEQPGVRAIDPPLARRIQPNLEQRVSPPPGHLTGLPVATRLGPAPNLRVRHRNDLPLRLAQGPDGRIHVSDSRSGSVFVYSAELVLEQELQGLEGPLGVAVDSDRRLYVGSDTNDRVEVFGPSGRRLGELGSGTIRMPNDLALGPPDRLYIADSRSDLVQVYATDGRHLMTIGSPGEGPGELRFPSALTLALREGAWELFVADQGNGRIQVFTADGVFLRALGARVAAAGGAWQGRFLKIQSLALDGLDRLHVLDSAMHTIQLLDPDSGGFLGFYGVRGTEPGELNLPLDLLVAADGRSVVTNAGSRRLETIASEVNP